jgi:hypothetical protein
VQGQYIVVGVSLINPHQRIGLDCLRTANRITVTAQHITSTLISGRFKYTGMFCTEIV